MYQLTSFPSLTTLTMCLGGHSSQELCQHMKEERTSSSTNNWQGGTDIALLHISGSSGEGISMVIIFVVMILLLSLGAVGLWFLWKCIRECNRGSVGEHDMRKTRKCQQRFSTLLEKQDRELWRIAKLEERFELQADNLRTDKARILQMLQGQHFQGARLPLRERNLTRQDSGTDASSTGDSKPLMRLPSAAPNSFFTSCDYTKPLPGLRALPFVPQPTGNNSSACVSSSTATMFKPRGGPWNTFGDHFPTHASSMWPADHLRQTSLTDSSWIAENHHRHCMARLQEDYRHIVDCNTPVENFADRHAHWREVGCSHSLQGKSH